jgi:hypothetical protein
MKSEKEILERIKSIEIEQASCQNLITENYIDQEDLDHWNEEFRLMINELRWVLDLPPIDISDSVFQQTK